MGVSSTDLVNFLYYKKLPQVYRDEDEKIGYPLKRYLEALGEGYNGAIQDITNLMLVLDPKALPEELFPYLCASFGIEYLPDIDITYQRKFLSNAGELVKRRGTYSSIHFLIRALTGLESELAFKDGVLSITLLAKNVEQVNELEPSIAIISNYISTQIPFFASPAFDSRTTTQVVISKSYSHSAIVSTKRYKLNTYKEGN